MYATGITLNASNYRTVFSGSSGRLYVPVKSNAVVFSQFDYVRGTPADKGERGVPVDRIRILNTLIDQLVSMRKSSVTKDDVTDLTDSQRDSLIRTYQNQIKQSIAVSSLPGTYGLAGLMPEPGAVLNITA